MPKCTICKKQDAVWMLDKKDGKWLHINCYLKQKP